MDEFGYTQADVAARLKMSQAGVSQSLSLLNLDPEIRAKVDEGAISTRAAQHIAKVASPEAQREVAAQVERGGLTEAETARVVREKRGGPKATAKGRGGKPKLPTAWKVRDRESGFTIVVERKKGFQPGELVEFLRDGPQSRGGIRRGGQARGGLGDGEGAGPTGTGPLSRLASRRSSTATSRGFRSPGRVERRLINDASPLQAGRRLPKNWNRRRMRTRNLKNPGKPPETLASTEVEPSTKRPSFDASAETISGAMANVRASCGRTTIGPPAWGLFFFALAMDRDSFRKPGG